MEVGTGQRQSSVPAQSSRPATESDLSRARASTIGTNPTPESPNRLAVWEMY